MAERILTSPAFYLEFPVADHRQGLDSVFVLRDRHRFAALSRTTFASPLSILRFAYDETGAADRPEITVLQPSEHRRRRAAPAQGWVFGARFRSARAGPGLLTSGILIDELFALQRGMMQRRASVPGLVAGMRRFAGLLQSARAALSDAGSAIPLPMRNADVSERTVRRRFKAQAGLTPKRHADLLRFHAALKQVVRGADSLGQVAQACRFADQAHLTRDFARRCGLPPGRFARHWSDRSVRIVQDGSLDPSIGLAILID